MEAQLRPTYRLFSTLIQSLRNKLKRTTMSKKECHSYLQSIISEAISKNGFCASRGQRKGLLLSPKVGPLLTLADDVGILREEDGKVVWKGDSSWSDIKLGQVLRDAHLDRVRRRRKIRSMKQRGLINQNPVKIKSRVSKPKIVSKTKIAIKPQNLNSEFELSVVINGFVVNGSVKSIRQLIKEKDA